MIIRIFNEGQFEVADSKLDELNAIDDSIEAAVEANDEPALQLALQELHTAVVTNGKPVAEDFIGESTLVLPDITTTIDEIRDILGDEGLIPD